MARKSASTSDFGTHSLTLNRSNHRILAALTLAVGVAFPVMAIDCTVVFDLVLTDALIIDGTGAAAYTGSVGIKDGRIKLVGDAACNAAPNAISVEGKIVAPGFIDVHSHADQALGTPETSGMPGLLYQGVTTAVFGVDGFGGLSDLLHLQKAMTSGTVGVNTMAYVGHNSVRQNAMGMANRDATVNELQAMKTEVRAAMEAGAIGLSSGLMYLPGQYSPTSEVIELAKVTAPYNGRYDSHIRNPTKDWLASVAECLEIGRKAGAHAHVAHLKAVGLNNFGKSQLVIDLINDELEKGYPITADVYPYDGATTRPVLTLLRPGLSEKTTDLLSLAGNVFEQGIDQHPDKLAVEAALIEFWQGIGPDTLEWHAAKDATESPADGIFSWIRAVGYGSMRVVVSKNKDLIGRMVVDIAAKKGISPFELFRQIGISEGADALVTLGAIQGSEVADLINQPWAMVASDGLEVNVTHPRGRGTFPRLIRRYSREWEVLSIEGAIHKITGQPANYLGLKDRGVIRSGAIADLVVFDPKEFRDTAGWTNPGDYAVGMHHVLINGDFALKGGKVSQNRLGRFIPYNNPAN